MEYLTGKQHQLGWLKLIKKRLCTESRMMSLSTGAREMFLCNSNSRKSKKSVHILCLLSITSCPGLNGKCSPDWDDSFCLLILGILGKSSMTSLRQRADFHPSVGWEEWEECIDVVKQTSALCVLEWADMRRNEPWDNQGDCQEHSSTAYIHYVISDLRI